MDQDSVSRLEEKVRAAIQEMERLRQENRRLTRELRRDGKGSPAAGSLEEDLRLLQQERAIVRSRIEGLIQSMEATR